MSKIIKYISALLLIVSAIITVIFYLNINSDSSVSLMINWAIILLVVCVLAAIVMPLFFSSGKSAKGSLIKVGIIIGLCAISYLMASSEPIQLSSAQEAPSASTLKFTDAGIILTTILLACSIISILASALLNIIKNR